MLNQVKYDLQRKIKTKKRILTNTLYRDAPPTFIDPAHNHPHCYPHLPGLRLTKVVQPITTGLLTHQKKERKFRVP